MNSPALRRGARHLRAALARAGRLDTDVARRCVRSIEVTIEALIRSHVRGRLRGVSSPPEFVRIVHERAGTSAPGWTRAVPIGCLRGAFGIDAAADAGRFARESCDDDPAFAGAVAEVAFTLVHGEPGSAAIDPLVRSVEPEQGAVLRECLEGLAAGRPDRSHPLVHDLVLELTGRAPSEDAPGFDRWWERYPGG